MYLSGEPLFPFGHGLSYTTFDYSKLTLSQNKIDPAGKITVSINVKNTGDKPGDEVVQLYVHQQNSSLKRPTKELRGFQRTNLKPGEIRTLTFALPAQKLAFYDIGAHAFVVPAGSFDIMVGSSSGNIRARTQLEVIKPQQP
jgi:beta-glucosidase